jgi:hypothetical protein
MDHAAVEIISEKFWDYADDKPMRQNWQGGQSSARRTRGFATDGTHGVTRPTQKVCHLHNFKKFAL